MDTPKKSLEIAFAVAEGGQGPQAGGREFIRVGPGIEIAEGTCKIVEHEAISIGVYKIEGRFHAIRNSCPHKGAPLCLGKVHTTHAPAAVGEFQPALPGRVLRCPWHGWEFDLVTGKGLYDAKGRVKTYATRVDTDGIVFVDL